MTSLSGRLLTLTVLFITLAEIFIFMPTVARYREDYFLARLERAQIAALSLLTSEDTIDNALEQALLRSADVHSVMLLLDDTRQLILSNDDMTPVSASFDLRDPPPWTLMYDAMAQIFNTQDTLIRVTGEPINEVGLLIEITLPTAPLRADLLTYSLQIIIISAVIAGMTAALMFFSVRRLLVLPIHRLVRHMTSYANAPEDATGIIKPDNTVHELRDAEEALLSLQTQLTSELRHRERLAQLGEAVAKISHDLRNILSVTTIMADRLETSSDPGVQRVLPKILASLSRAVNLTESTLAFGSAQEPAPRLDRINLHDLAHDVVENDHLAAEAQPNAVKITYACNVSPDVIVRADPEQLHRVLSNLVKNAREAILMTGKPGDITLTATQKEKGWEIAVSDTGPGLPKKAKEHLFQPFQGGVRKGGTGLGLAIAAEIIRGHGGRLELADSTPEGTTFTIWLPFSAGS